MFTLIRTTLQALLGRPVVYVIAFTAALPACSPKPADGEMVEADALSGSARSSALDQSPARIDRLVAALSGTSNRAADAASDSLATIGAAATDALIPLLQDNDVRARRLAVRAMVDYGPRAEAAVPALARLLEPGMPTDRTRDDAIRALRSIGPAAAPAAPALVALLDARVYAADSDSVFAALAAIGPGARPVLPALLPYLPSGGAPMAVGRLGGPDALAALERVLLHPNGGLAPDGSATYTKKELDAVAAALAIMGPSGLAVVDRARAAEVPRVRSAAIAGYRSAGAAGVAGLVVLLTDARPCRVDDLTNEPILCRADAARALGAIGPPARSALPALERTMREASDEDTQGAVRGAMVDVRGEPAR